MNTEIEIDSKIIKAGFWHMPKLFYLILFIELFERFAFYGFQTIVFVYAKNFNISLSNKISLASLNIILYALIIIGGVIGDKILGLRRSYIFGLSFLLFGYSFLFIFNNFLSFNFCVGLILIGNILFKTNAVNYISRCFEAKDPRLDAAYTYFYMFMSIGCFVGIILVPILIKIKFSSIIFFPLFILLAIFIYLVFKKEFIHSDNQAGKNNRFLRRVNLIVIVIGVIIAYILGLLLEKLNLCQYMFYLFSGLTIIICLLLAIKLDKNESKGIYLALNLILIASVFWIIFLQIISVISTFSLHYVKFNLFGYDVSSNIINYFPPFLIIIFAPVFARLYIFLQKQNIQVSIPLKFNLAIAILGISLLILALATKYFIDTNYQISVVWIFLIDILLSFSTLLVLAIGPSMVSQLFPKRFGSFAQVVWFLAIAIGILIKDKLFAFVYVLFDIANNSTIKVFDSYSMLFLKFGSIIIAFSLFLLFFSKMLTEKMQEVIIHRT